MRPEPRIRVSAILRWNGRILLCRHEKRGRENWLLPGGGVRSGETLTEALQRELARGDRADRGRRRDSGRGPGRDRRVDLARAEPLVEARRARRLRRRARPDRSPTSSPATTPCAVIGSSSSTSSRACRSIRRSAASCAASSPVTLRLPRIAVGPVERSLAWDGCFNVRDLGGLETASGGRTRHGAVVRADNVRRLTDGRVAGGARPRNPRVVDLRFESESPGEADAHADVEVIVVSLFGAPRSRTPRRPSTSASSRPTTSERSSRPATSGRSSARHSGSRGAWPPSPTPNDERRRPDPLLRGQGSNRDRHGAPPRRSSTSRTSDRRRLRGERRQPRRPLRPWVARRATTTSARAARCGRRSRRRDDDGGRARLARRARAAPRYLASGLTLSSSDRARLVDRRAQASADASQRRRLACRRRDAALASAAGARAARRRRRGRDARARRRAARARRRRRRARAPGRAASRRAPGSAGAAARGGRCRSPQPTRQPSKPDAPSFPCPATTRPSGCRAGVEQRPAGVVLEAGHRRRDDRRDRPRAARRRSAASRPRPSRAGRARRPASRSRRGRGSRARAAGSRRTRRGAPFPSSTARRRSRRLALRGRARSAPARDPGRRRRRSRSNADGSSAVARRDAGDLERVPAERRPTLEDGDVAAVGVDVQVVRVEVGDADPHGVSSQNGRTRPRETAIARRSSIAV